MRLCTHIDTWACVCTYAHVSYLLTYLLTYLPTYLLTYLLAGVEHALGLVAEATLE